VKSKFISVVLVGFLFSFCGQIFAANLKDRTVVLERQVESLQNQIATMKNENKNLDFEKYFRGPSVATSPAFGIRRSADDASDLMVSLSSIHEDLILLQLRKKMDRYARANKVEIPQRPVVALSGGVEGQANYVHNYNKTERNDINLSRAELDVIGEAGPWATAAMIISYDKDRPATGARVTNSRLTIDRAFATIGQLEKCPIYFTIGQIYAPFGKFSSYMVTTPSMKALGRFKDRMAVLGFSQDFTRGESSGVVSMQVYGYPGETKVQDNNIVEHGGFNLDLEFKKDKFALKIGGSVIGNIAESDGMQSNIFNYSGALGAGSTTITDRVYGIDGRIKASFDRYTLLAEYVGAGKCFNVNDLSHNGQGAKPQALSIEGAVDFQIADKPNTLAAGYGQTWQALALRLPRNTFFASYGLSFWKNTIFSVEYRHDVNYQWSDTAQGNGPSGGSRMTPVTVNVTDGGRHKNTVTAQFGIYF